MSETEEFAKPDLTPEGLASGASEAWLVLAGFFLSGASALIYEIVWQRVLVRLLGATVHANCVILSLFMLGILIGSLASCRYARRSHTNLKTIAILEAAIGLSGLASLAICQTASLEKLIDLLLWMTPALIEPARIAILYAIVFLLLLIPAVAMGATLPLLEAASGKTREETVGRSYAANTSGAVIGTMCSAFILLPGLGISMSLVCAAAGNALACACLFLAEGKREEHSEPAAEPPESKSRPGRSLLCFLVLASGLISMLMEVIWSRYLVIIFGSSSYALALVLAAFLTGLAIAAWLARHLAAREVEGPSTTFAAPLLALSGIALALNLCQYQYAPRLYLELLGGSGMHGLSMLLLTVWIVILPSILIGSIFPYALSRWLAAETGQTGGRGTATLLAFNLSGSIAGALLAATAFTVSTSWFPQTKIETATLIASLSLCLIALLVTMSDSEPRRESRARRLAIVLIGLCLVILGLRPQWNKRLLASGIAYTPVSLVRGQGIDKAIEQLESAGGTILLYRESANSTLAVKESRKENLLYLTANGKTEAALPAKPDAPAPGSDLATHTLMGVLPGLLIEKKAYDALVIGFGSGTTCGAALSDPSLRSLTSIEIDPGMYRTSSFFLPINSSPLRQDWIQSRRFRPVLGDARNHLALSRSTYDIIISQPQEPWIAGAADLYSSEFFQLIHSRLRDGGVFCQWLQLYSIPEKDLAILLNTIKQSFPNTYIWRPARAGEIIVTAFKDKDRLDVDSIRSELERPETRKQMDRIGIYGLESLLSNILVFPCQLEGCDTINSAQLNTDDNLMCQYSLTRQLGSSQPADSQIDMRMRFLSRMIDRSCLEQSIAPGVDARLITGLCTAYSRMLSGPRGFETDTALSAMFTDRLLNRSDTSSSAQAHLRTLLYQTKGRRDLLPLRARISQLLKDGSIETGSAGDQSTPASSTTSMACVRARLHIDSGKPELALEALSSLPVEPPTYRQSYELGMAFLRLGKLGSAETHLDRAISLRPDSPEALSASAVVKRLSGKAAVEVSGMLARSLALDPNQYVSRYCLGQALLRSSDYEGSMKEMYLASRTIPDQAAPNLFVTAAQIRVRYWKEASSNLAVLRRKLTDSPATSALACLIAVGAGNRQLEKKSRADFKRQCGVELTDGLAAKILAGILESPTPVTRSDINNLIVDDSPVEH